MTFEITNRMVASVALIWIGLDLFGGFCLAYDLLSLIKPCPVGGVLYLKCCFHLFTFLHIYASLGF
jgi:hypothetical protein